MSDLSGIFSAAQARIAQQATLARQILADLGAQSVAHFNDDDWYVFDPATLELTETIASQSARAEGASHWFPPKVGIGLIAKRGLAAKHLGLWRYADQGDDCDAHDDTDGQEVTA